MAAQQIQVKLFTYSVVERKDEIEEVSAQPPPLQLLLLRQRRMAVDDIRSLAVPAHYRTYNAVPCVCV